MCRSIKQLRQPAGPPSDEELEAAALQFVRKISGYRQPSRANQAAFTQAVQDIAAASRVLFENLVAPSLAPADLPTPADPAILNVVPGG